MRRCLLRVIYVRMTLEEFRESLNSERPPEDLTLSLAAMWWDAKGDWMKAHESGARGRRACRCVGPRLPSSQGRRRVKFRVLVWPGRKASIPHIAGPRVG